MIPKQRGTWFLLLAEWQKREKWCLGYLAFSNLIRPRRLIKPSDNKSAGQTVSKLSPTTVNDWKSVALPLLRNLLLNCNCRLERWIGKREGPKTI